MNGPRQRHRITSSDGTAIAVQEWGDASGSPVLFVHAWSQSHVGWMYALDHPMLQSLRLVSFDQRGHGESQAPDAIEAYTGNSRWAGDVHAIIEALGLTGVTLVGWSLGGVVVLDYLQHHGVRKVRAINLSGAGNAIGTERAQSHFGAAAAHAPAALGEPLAPRVQALLALQQALVHRELPIEEFALIFGQALVAAPLARSGWMSRVVDHEPTLRSLSLPILLSHGDADHILTLQAPRDAQAFAPHARLSIYPGGGHAPHLEDPHRFARELLHLVSTSR